FPTKESTPGFAGSRFNCALDVERFLPSAGVGVEEGVPDREYSSLRDLKVPQLSRGWRRTSVPEIGAVEDGRSIGNQPDQERVGDEMLAVRRAPGETKLSRAQHRPSNRRQESEEPPPAQPSLW